MKKPVIAILSALAGAALGAGLIGRLDGKKAKKGWESSNKHLELFRMMSKWVELKQKGKSLADYFEKNGYKKIAIYGMSYAGEALLGELKGSTVAAAYGIDKNADAIYADIDVVTMDDNLDEVDAVVVTAITFFDEIEEQLSKKMECPIISLEDILYEV